MTRDELEKMLNHLGAQVPSQETTERLGEYTLNALWEADKKHLHILMQELDATNALACLISHHMGLVCTYLDACGGDAAIVGYLQKHIEKYLLPPPAPNQPKNRWAGAKP